MFLRKGELEGELESSKLFHSFADLPSGKLKGDAFPRVGQKVTRICPLFSLRKSILIIFTRGFIHPDFPENVTKRKDASPLYLISSIANISRKGARTQLSIMAEYSVIPRPNFT